MSTEYLGGVVVVFSVRYVRYYNSDSITCDLTHVTDGQINLPAGVLFSRISLRADQHAVALLHPLGSVITHTGGLEDVTGRNTNLGLGQLSHVQSFQTFQS